MIPMDVNMSDDVDNGDDWDDSSLEGEDEEDPTQDPNPSDVATEDTDSDNAEETFDDEVAASAWRDIEGDFQRLVNNIKGSDGKTMGISSSTWDISIQEAEDFDVQAELRATSGIGSRRRRGRRRGPRDRPVLSQQVKSLLGQANAAYVSQNIPETIRLLQEVIRIEPRDSSAWTTLALCHTDLGEPGKALQLNIIGAHLLHDVELWLKLGNDSKNLGYLQQALYCYRKACTLDPDDVTAQWDRGSLSKEIGDLRTARNAFLAIMKRYPHDVSVLEELRPVLVDLSEITRGIQLYQDAFDYYQNIAPSGVTQDAQGNDIVGGGFSDLQIIVLADFYVSVRDFENAITTIRRGARWLQGRRDQLYWDSEVDDREYDIVGMSRGEHNGAVLEAGYVLDLNLRHRLAIARLKLGEQEEGKLHSSVILSQDIKEHAVLFTEIADAMFEQKLYDDALSVYEALSSDETTSSFRIVFQAAACHRNLGNFSDAAQVYQHVIAGEPDNIDAKMNLAEVYEAMNEPKKALNLVYEVIDARKRLASREVQADSTVIEDSNTSLSLFQEKRRTKSKRKRGMSLAQLLELELEHEARTKCGFETLKELAPKMKEGDFEAENAWLVEAEALVESYREVKPLFPATRQEFRGMPAWRRAGRKSQKDLEKDEVKMASRLQLELEYEKVAPRINTTSGGKVTEFRRVPFEDWLLLFMEYAFLLTKRDRFSLAEEVIRHAMQSVVFQEPESMDTLRLALITCAIRARSYDTVVSMCRKLINSHQFHNDPPRILLAALASGLLPVDAFTDNKLQKHLFRETKLIDAVVKGKEVRWNQHNRRYQLTGGDEATKEDAEEGEDDEARTSTAHEKPTKNNPIMVGIYGQLSAASRSYQSAIFYLLHSYDYQPNDPVICLSLSVAYLGRAMQRQADNRHYMIAQSLAFLSRYRSIREGDDRNLDEIEYNFGRAFHQIGLFHHAARHYERVLSQTEEHMRTDPSYVGLSKEAAYNLSLIYMMTGATRLVQSLYRRWLTL